MQYNFNVSDIDTFVLPQVTVGIDTPKAVG